MNRYQKQYGTPSDRARDKVVDHMIPYVADFIRHAPFAVLATADADGHCDASPKGGRPGFAKVLDERHLLLPDVRGKRRQRPRLRRHRAPRGTRSCFATPQQAWERATNENTKGLLRLYLPKRCSMASLSQVGAGAKGPRLPDYPARFPRTAPVSRCLFWRGGATRGGCHDRMPGGGLLVPKTTAVLADVVTGSGQKRFAYAPHLRDDRIAPRQRPSRRTGRIAPYAWPSQKAMKAVRAKIRAHTARRRLYVEMADLVGALNRIIRGWRVYFPQGNATKKLADLDWYVRRRLWHFFKHRRGSRGRLTPRAFAEWERRSGLTYFYPKGRSGLRPCMP